MSSVLEVSTVDLWAAVAYLVMATPVALKQAMDTIMKPEYNIRIGWFPKSATAALVFSRYPSLHRALSQS